MNHPTPSATGTSPLDIDLARFVDRIRVRLIKGAEAYGNTSFTRPAAEIVDEVQQELEDVAGWSLLLWIRLARLRGRVEQLGTGGTHGES